MHNATHGNDGYEKKDVNVRKTVIACLAMVVVLVGSVFVLDEVFFYAKEHVYYKEVLKPESKQLRDLHARETETLNNYKVIDREKGVYQIPIERAMELMAREAYQARLQGASTTTESAK